LTRVQVICTIEAHMSGVFTVAQPNTLVICFKNCWKLWNTFSVLQKFSPLSPVST